MAIRYTNNTMVLLEREDDAHGCMRVLPLGNTKQAYTREDRFLLDLDARQALQVD
jgi:hypothetical protein